MATEDPARALREVPAERALDRARGGARLPGAGRDPGAPQHPGRKEQLLLAGFVVCLVIAVVTVVMPELSNGDAAHKQPQAAPSR